MKRRAEVAGVTWRQLRRDAMELIADPVQVRWMLEEVSGFDGVRLLRELDSRAPLRAVDRLDSLLKRLLSGEPLQHVLGHWGFRTLDVVVDTRVLVPRPETEVVVTLALAQLDRICALPPGPEVLVVDLGTGSGVIGLSLAVERSSVRVIAVDRDAAALEVATINLAAIAAEPAGRVQLRQGDWYQGLPRHVAGEIALIVANPPYLAEHEWLGLEPTVKGFDPFGALVAGPSGLEAIEAIVAGAPTWLRRHGALVVEIAPTQARAAMERAREAGFSTVSVEDDLAGRPRVLVAVR